MRIIMIAMFVCLFGFQLSFIYADTVKSPASNFTYHEILANRLTQPLPGNYQCNPSFTSGFELSSKITRYTNKSSVLRFFLMQDGSLSRETYDYCISNFSGDIVLMNFGKYANMSVNFKNAAMRNEYIQISIPFGSWYQYSKHNLDSR